MFLPLGWHTPDLAIKRSLLPPPNWKKHKLLFSRLSQCRALELLKIVCLTKLWNTSIHIVNTSPFKSCSYPHPFPAFQPESSHTLSCKSLRCFQEYQTRSQGLTCVCTTNLTSNSTSCKSMPTNKSPSDVVSYT